MIQHRKGFRKPEDFVAAAERPPEQTVIDPEKGISVIPATEPPSAPTEPEQAQNPPTADAEPATPIADAVETLAPAPEAVKANGKGKKKGKPWDEASPKVKVPFMMRLPEALHLKLRWIDENVPKSVSSSIHATILAGAEKEVERILKAHFKDENA